MGIVFSKCSKFTPIAFATVSAEIVRLVDTITIYTHCWFCVIYMHQYLYMLTVL